MARRSTYSRAADPDTGASVHSINLTTIQFWLVFLGQLLAVVAGGVGALTTVGRPVLRELIDQRNGETTVPRIDRLETSERTAVPRSEFAVHLSSSDRKEEALIRRFDSMDARLDQIYRLLTERRVR